MRWTRTLLVGLATCLFAAAAAAQSPVTSPNVAIHQDVVYGHKSGMALTFDVYQPQDANGAGVVFLNSGGWVSPYFALHEERDGETQLRRISDPPQFSAQLLTAAGFTVFNLRHGSAPKFVLPEVVEDVRLAIREIRQVAPDYGVDPDRLGLWGASAGGHLSLLLGAAPEVGPEGQAADSPSAPVAAIVAFYPASEMSTQRVAATRYFREVRGQELVAVLPAFNYSTDLDEALSPLEYASPGDPPTLIIHGDQDDLVPLRQGRLMEEALREAGVVTELLIIEGAGHGFGAGDLERALAASLEWFQRHLGG